MGIGVVLCALSPTRQELLEKEPELLEEVLESRRDVAIPGLVDVGGAWDALDKMLNGGKAQGVLADAVLGRSGKPFGRRGSFGKPRLLEAARVKEVAAALEALPEDWIARGYGSLAGMSVQGDYGQEVPDPDDPPYLKQKVQETRERELTELRALFGKLREAYRNAAKSGHAMLVSVG
jgi:hypothetical protein